MEKFANFTKPLIGLEVTHVWMGYGSAIFLEFGELRVKVSPSGKVANHPEGEMTLFACEGWRVEGKRRVWCGSDSEKEKWTRSLNSLDGARVLSISLTGRLGEIELSLSNGLHFSTFVTNRGYPDWSLRDRQHIHLGVVAGRICFDRRNEVRS